MLGTSLSRRRRTEATVVTPEMGRRRAPYPSTTVSLWTNPSAPSRSASTTLMLRPGGYFLAAERMACAGASRTLVADFCPPLSVYFTVTLAPVCDARSSTPMLLEPCHTRASAVLNVQVDLLPFTVRVLPVAS